MAPIEKQKLETQSELELQTAPVNPLQAPLEQVQYEVD